MIIKSVALEYIVARKGIALSCSALAGQTKRGSGNLSDYLETRGQTWGTFSDWSAKGRFESSLKNCQIWLLMVRSPDHEAAKVAVDVIKFMTLSEKFSTS